MVSGGHRYTWDQKEIMMMNYNIPIEITSMTQTSFKERLIEHFDIVWNKNQVKWPSCTGLSKPRSVDRPNWW